MPILAGPSLILLILTASWLPAEALRLDWTDSDWSTGNYESSSNVDGRVQPGVLVLNNRVDDMRWLCDPADWQGIYSMSVYHDSLFLAMSDHPFSYDGADIWVYDYRTGQFALDYQPFESGVLVTKVFGDSLYVPGPDSMDPWYDFGSIYTYTGREWIEHDTIPTAVHVCDVELVNGILYVSTGHATGPLNGCGCVWVSYDYGDSFTRVLTIYPDHDHMVRRFFGLGHHGDRVFAHSDGFPPQNNVVYSTTNGTEWDTIPLPYLPTDKHAVFTAWGDSTLMTIHDRLYIWNGSSFSPPYMLPWDGYRWDRGIARYKGDLYGGGLDLHVYKWNGGSQWTQVGSLGLDPDSEEIESMAVYYGRLYVGTSRHDLTQTAHLYVSAAVPGGWLISAPHDFGTAIATGTLRWEDCRPGPENTTRFRLRSGTTIEEMRQQPFVGPDGTGATWYTTSGTPIHETHEGDRFFQYYAGLVCPLGLHMPFLDSITLEAYSQDPSGLADASPGAASGGLRLRLASPVRASDGLRAWFETAGPAEVRVRITDAEGRLLRSDRVALDASGAASWSWDLRDARGRLLPAGVYRATARVEGRQDAPLSRSLVVVP
jgi:hypothetical protein